MMHPEKQVASHLITRPMGDEKQCDFCYTPSRTLHFLIHKEMRINPNMFLDWYLCVQCWLGNIIACEKRP